MKKENKINIAIIVVFLSMLILPSIIYYFVKDNLIEINNEKRALAEKPSIELETIEEYPENFDNYYNDNLPFRRFIQRQYNNMDHYIFRTNSFNNVIIGKKTEKGKMQWLFYNKKSDGDPIQYAIGSRQFTDEEKNNTVMHIKQNIAFTESRNIKLCYFIAPNKSTIYKELLPSNIKIKNNNNCIQELFDYVKSKGVNNIIYPYKELTEAKSNAYTYYSTDSHWNEYGGFISSKLLHNMIDSNYNYLFNNVNIQFGGLYDFQGDLATMIDLDIINGCKEQEIKIDNFLDDSKYSRDETNDICVYVNNEPLIDKDVMIIGDSFNYSFANNYAKIYAKVTFLPFYVYTQDAFNAIAPDIVIVEAAERYIDNMIDLVL